MALLRGVVESEGVTALVSTHDPVMMALADRAVRIWWTVGLWGLPSVGELLWRRGRAQAGVLAAVLAVMVAGAALVGACVLLMTASPQRALQLAMADAPGDEVQVGVALGFPEEPDDPDVDERVAATARDASGAVAQASDLVTSAFGDLPTTQTVWTSTVMQYLPPDGDPLRLAYLSELDDLDARGTVVSGAGPPLRAR